MIVHVVLPLPIDQSYSYEVPPDLSEEARVGCRVLVPFGHRRLTGLIVETAEAVSPSEQNFTLKPILDILDERPVLNAEMLSLTRWIADYYVCSWGEVVKAALPSGTEVEEQKHIERTALAPGLWGQDPRTAPLLDHLASHPDVTLNSLQQHGLEVSQALLRRLERDGLIRLVKRLRQPKVRIKREKHVRMAPAFRSPSAQKDLTTLLRGVRQVAVIETLADLALEGMLEPSQAEVLARAQATSSVLKSLAEKGIIEVFDKEVMRVPTMDRGQPVTSRHVLHPSQQKALEKIGEAIETARFEAFLLHGVTGSGKTEVYIEALKKVLARGKTGIILVPEISLTPQTVRRFQRHFGDQIAVLHSRMGLGERYDVWRGLHEGRFSVVIGPRSAIFAPLSNLGLLVVDEEHEPSYKQFDPAPRYHARDVAVVRAQQNGAVCILGSATPSLESFHNALTGKYTLLEMPDRVPVAGHAAAPMPDIQVIDLALEHKKHRLHGALSETLRQAIQDRLARKEQVILLQNRRGYAPIIECQACGFVPVCIDCSVTMTYHKARHHLRCHYCGRVQRPLKVCPACGEAELAQLGAGTQRVEEELAQLFPEAVILRMDLDTTSRKDAHHTILSRFGKGEADILIGTQMVAKGLDFSRVTLVGVINADTGIRLPDFRAEERTFQLLTQVAGRAGRADLRGEVLLQTRNPTDPVFRYIRGHAYEAFGEAMLKERHALGYPPFGRIVGVEFSGAKERQVEEMARQWTALLSRQVPPSVQILGPAPAFVGRIKRQYRHHTLLKIPRTVRAIQEVLRSVNASFGQPPSGCYITIDIDAIGLF